MVPLSPSLGPCTKSGGPGPQIEVPGPHQKSSGSDNPGQDTVNYLLPLGGGGITCGVIQLLKKGFDEWKPENLNMPKQFKARGMDDSNIV